MKILIAEDDRLSNRMLAMLLEKWGHEVIGTNDGTQAWDALQQPNPPQLAVFDWMMPGMSGLQLCQVSRVTPALKGLYIILLTTLGRTEDVVTGLDGGANDYVVKPFNAAELRARINVGVRVVQLQNELTERIREVRESREQIQQLQGILPICSYCKKIRDDKNYWQQVENYVSAHSEASFSHSICPDCYERYIRPQLAQLPKKPGNTSA